MTGKAFGGGHFQETAIPKTPTPLRNSAVSTLRSQHVAYGSNDRIASLLQSRLPMTDEIKWPSKFSLSRVRRMAQSARRLPVAFLFLTTTTSQSSGIWRSSG